MKFFFVCITFGYAQGASLWRHIIILCLFFAALNLQGQTGEKRSGADAAKQLTGQELSSAKELYLKMMESEIYKASRKNMLTLVTKLNGVPPPQKTDNLQKYFESRLSETKFGSAEEAISCCKEGIALQVKLFEENRELYLLISKASRPQIAEILQAEYDNMAKQYQN